MRGGVASELMPRHRRQARAGASRAWPSRARGACCRRPIQPARRVVLCYHSVNPSAELPRRSRPTCSTLTWPGSRSTARWSRWTSSSPGRRPAAARTSRSPSTTATPTTTPTRCRCLAARGMTASFFVAVGLPRARRRGHGAPGRGLADAERPAAPAVLERGGASCAPRGCRSARTPGAIATSRDLPIDDAEARSAAARGRCSRSVSASPCAPIAYPWGKLGRHVTERDLHGRAPGRYELGLISLPRAVRDSDDAPADRRGLGSATSSVERLAAKVTGAIDWHAYVHERMPGPGSCRGAR